jgi:MFS family permease
VLSLSLTGARRLSRPFVLGVILWGAPLVVLGLWAELVPALILLGIVGAGASTMDIAGFTLVQRAVPDEVLARVFGVIQMLWILAVGIGALVAPAIVEWLGVEGALIATGATLVALVGVLWRQLAEIDATATVPEAGELRLLTANPIFAPLPGTSLEHLAARLIPLRLEEGATIIREGDAGDRFYIVAEGTVEVSQDGKMISKLVAGAHFGEIALMRDLPRTATVTAKTPVVLYALEREDFLAAVTGHPPSAQAAEEVISARLANFGPSGVRVAAS